MTDIHSNASEGLGVLIVDDNAEVRRALRLLLSHESQYRVIGELVGMAGLLPAVEVTRPAVVLVDLALPGLSVEVLDRLRRLRPGVWLIGLASSSPPGRSLTECVDSVVREADGAPALLGALASYKARGRGSH